jgi:hypothetical protein
MHNAARLMFHDHKHIEGFEEDSVDGGIVASPDFVSMILEKGAPVLSTGVLSDLLDVFLDGAFVHHNLQFEQFTVDFLGTPTGILSGHLLDEGDGLSRNTGFPALGCRLSFPVTSKHIPVPTQDGVWLDDMQGRLPEVGQSS